EIDVTRQWMENNPIVRVVIMSPDQVWRRPPLLLFDERGTVSDLRTPTRRATPSSSRSAGPRTPFCREPSRARPAIPPMRRDAGTFSVRRRSRSPLTRRPQKDRAVVESCLPYVYLRPWPAGMFGPLSLHPRTI